MNITKKDLVYFKDENTLEPFLVLGFEDDKLILGLRDYPQTEMDYVIDPTIVNYYVDDQEFELAKRIIMNKIN